MRPGDGDTLLLAAGEVVDAAGGRSPRGITMLQHLGRPAVLDAASSGILCSSRRREGDVLEHVQMGKQGVPLEDGVDMALVGRDRSLMRSPS